MMMHTTKSRSALFGAAILVGLASFGFARPAEASPDFPGLLQQALEKELGQTFCVPLCTACHNTAQGGPGMLNKFGSTLETYGLQQLNDPTVATAVHNLVTAAMPPDSDDDGTSDVNELKQGDSPSIAGPNGVGQFCSDIRYGCGARIAPAPPPMDRLGLFSAGAVVLGLALVARRRRRSKQPIGKERSAL